MARMVSVDQLQPAFDNAMDHLYRRMSETFSSDRITVGATVREFNKEFDCYLMHDSDFEWDVVGFKNDEQQLMFMLKWS